MDEDIRFTMSILCLGTTSGTTRYWQVPYACTFRDLIAIAGNSDPGVSETVTVTNATQSHTLGVATFGADIAAGAKATWVADATYGNLVCAAGDILTFVATADAATDIIELIIELDPKCRAA
jgi:hypothetical protein